MLEAAGLLSTRREGRFKLHHIDTSPLEPIVERWLRPARTTGAARHLLQIAAAVRR